MKILGQYKITYDNGVVQYKNLIEHQDYLLVVIPKQKEAYELELKKKDREASRIKRELKTMFGELWFTNQSPLFAAISTGVLTQLPHAPYTCSCQVIKLN